MSAKQGIHNRSWMRKNRYGCKLHSTFTFYCQPQSLLVFLLKFFVCRHVCMHACMHVGRQAEVSFWLYICIRHAWFCMYLYVMYGICETFELHISEGIYVTKVWEIKVAFFSFWLICAVMWGLYVEHSRSVVEHIFAM